jgi:hypothetical protein
MHQQRQGCQHLHGLTLCGSSSCSRGWQQLLGLGLLRRHLGQTLLLLLLLLVVVKFTV